MKEKEDSENYDNTGNMANELLVIDDEEEDIKENSFADALTVLTEAVHKKHPKRNAIITHENKLGIVRARVLNNYNEKYFGYRFEALDVLCEETEISSVSVDGQGLKALDSIVKSISASFEQTQLPTTLNRLIGR